MIIVSFSYPFLLNFKKVSPSQKGHVKITMLNAIVNSQQPLNPTPQHLTYFPHWSYSYSASSTSSFATFFGSHSSSSTFIPLNRPPSPFSQRPSLFNASHPFLYSSRPLNSSTHTNTTLTEPSHSTNLTNFYNNLTLL